MSAKRGECMGAVPAALDQYIDTAGEHIKCDAACKRVLAIKEIDSRILKTVACEYKDCAEEEILACISDIETGISPVHADSAPLVREDDCEDSSLTEGTVRYDVKFTARIPEKAKRSEGEISVIVNIEAQNRFNPGYSLLKRGIYYCCRLISSQYNRIFTNSDYDKLKKVYSIWICTSPDKEHRNSIIRYSLSPEILLGNSKLKDSSSDHDLINLVMICLDDSYSLKTVNGNISSEQSLVNMLSALFDPNLKAEEKKNILKNDFSLQLTREASKEVEEMCNLSYGFLDKGIEKGIEKGRAAGKAEGIIMGAISAVAGLCDNREAFFDMLKKTGYTEADCHKLFAEHPEIMPDYLKTNDPKGF